MTSNDKGTTALGLTSGTTYHQVGATVVTGNSTPTAPEEFTRVNIINLIARGSAPKLFVEELFHVTVNANGVEVSFYDVSAIRCQARTRDGEAPGQYRLARAPTPHTEGCPRTHTVTS